MQPECKCAEYLSVVKCVSNRRLTSRFRIRCHGLQVEIGCWADTVYLHRTDSLCAMCESWRTSSTLFHCSAYSHVRSQHLDLLQHCCTIADFPCVRQMHVVVSLQSALHVGSKSCLYDFTELNFLSFGSRLPPRTLNIPI